MTRNPVIDPDTLPHYTPQPRFECSSKGVYYIPVKTDKDGNVTDGDPMRLADAIDLIGTGTDRQGNYYRIIRYRDRISRQNKTALIAAAEIGTNACWQRLQGMGITVQAGKVRRERLTDYLQTFGANTAYTVTDKAGWLNGSYILPSGEVLCADDNSRPVIYNGDTSHAAAYTVSGSLKDWQQQIARYMAGNSRLCLAIGTALAAPLLAILHEPNGGFHLYGDSSDGKTTAAKVALSVWGEAEALKLSWRGTDLGFSNAALARNDGLLVLDEIGEAAAHTVSKTAYSVINGKSKTQGAKDGGNRQQSEWRTLLLSTGEHTLKSYLERSGGTWEAGQSVRLPSIPAATRYGIYENLHGFAKGSDLSDHLTDAITRQHGSAGRAWIALLQRTEPAAIRAARDAFLQTLPELDGQALRVARRFALVSAALELAAEITGLPAGVGMTGVRQCFDDWLTINGTGKYEDKATIEQVADFMQMYADTLRFTDWGREWVNNAKHAGYRKEIDKDLNEYWVVPSVFRDEVLANRDLHKSCKVLNTIGWLKKGDKGWQAGQIKGKGRFYILMGAEPPETEPS
ncbi:MAG: DUF927 domain-containing protein [Conchiformibius sp.]|nr:DUF927 domain-containing protein [Conchiformibius sp.]